MFEEETKEIIMKKHDLEKMESNLKDSMESRWDYFYITLSIYLEDIKRFQWGFSTRVGKYKIIPDTKGWWNHGFIIKYDGKKILRLRKISFANIYECIEFKEQYIENIKELFQIIKTELENRISNKVQEIDKEKAFFELINFGEK